MSSQIQLSFSDDVLKIKKTSVKLTKAEEFYKNVIIQHQSGILFQGRFGSKHDDCGNFKSAFSCECGKTTKIIYKSCNNINCPNCHVVVNRRSARRIGLRLFKILSWLRDKMNVDNPSFNHITFGFRPEDSPDIHSKKDYIKFKNFFMKILRKYNASGVLFFHPYRKEYVTEKFTGRLIYSPHFHLIGNMWVPPDFYKKYGFVIKKIKNRKTNVVVKLFKLNHIISTVNYILTHTGYFENSKMSVWIGDYSYRKLKEINRTESYEYYVCDDKKGGCGSFVYKIDLGNIAIGEPYCFDRDYYYIRSWWRNMLDHYTKLSRKIIDYQLKMCWTSPNRIINIKGLFG